MKGMQRRLNKIIRKSTGRSLVIAVDHGMMCGCAIAPLTGRPAALSRELIQACAEDIQSWSAQRSCAMSQIVSDWGENIV